MESIGSNAFYGCFWLMLVLILPSVTEIGDCAFSSCSNLAKVSTSQSVVSIGSAVFVGISKDAEIEIPSNLYSMYKSVFNPNVHTILANDDDKSKKKCFLYIIYYILF